MQFSRTWISLCVLAALAALSAAAPVQEHFAVQARAQRYSHIVVFGDSMVDNVQGVGVRLVPVARQIPLHLVQHVGHRHCH